MCKLLFGVLVVPLLLSSTSSFRVVIDGAVRSIVGKLSSQSSLNAHGKAEVFNSAGGSSEAHNNPAHEMNSTRDLSLVAVSRKQEKVFSSVGSGIEERNTTTDETNYSEHLSLVTRLGSSDSLKPTVPIGTETIAAESGNMSLPKKGPPLGKGSFGVVYEGTYKGQEVAIKTEPKDAKKKLLANEVLVLRALQPGEGEESGRRVGVPKLFVKQALRVGDEVWMVAERFASDLERFKGELSDQDVIWLAVKMFGVLSYIHGKGYLHCDIKPENTMLDKDRKNLFLIDFGLSREVGDTRHGDVGSPRFKSIYAMQGHRQSYRDDLISTIYTLLYLAKPVKMQLPWSGLPPGPDRDERILAKKVAVTHTKLYAGISAGLVPRFQNAYRYCMDLENQEAPDYQVLEQYFTV